MSMIPSYGVFTNYGEEGATKREAGQLKFYPYKPYWKGDRKSFGVVFTQKLGVLAILEGETQKVFTLYIKRGALRAHFFI